MQMPFREMMMTKHKAYLAHWLTKNIRTTEELPGGVHSVSYFLMEPVREALHSVLYGSGSTGLPVFFRDVLLACQLEEVRKLIKDWENQVCILQTLRRG